MDASIPKKPPDQLVKEINVLLLKNCDFRGEDGEVFMPTDGERSTLKRRPHLGQYKSKVEFHASMSEDMVKKKLQEIFPYLKSRSFTCAAVKSSSQCKRFEFHGSPRIWDGKTILDKLKWNSALYILEDEASLQSETELSSTNTLEGGDDDMNSIATDTNQASSQSETELSSTNILQGGDDEMISIATYTNQMSDSSDEVFSSTNNATSSGISGSEPEFSKDVTDMSSLLQWLQNYFHFDIIGNPNYSHLQGGGPIIFTFTPPLPSAVTSVLATFEWLGTIELERLKNGSWLGYFPASLVPTVINVMLKSQNDILLGQTKVTYGVNLQQVVSCPSELQTFCENYYNKDHGSVSGNPGTSGGETENSRNLGFKQQVQMLCLMIYVAAECGAQQSLEIIFTSSAGIVAFNAYKNNLTLPEVIARDHGNTETANYLEGITKRFSEEIRTGKECSQTIDWSELAKAAKAAQKQHNITGHEERDVPKETGYLGDVETSSSESSEPHSSDSEDDISTTSSNGSIGQKGDIQLKRDLVEDCLGEAKEIKTEEEKWKRPDWVYEDHATETNKTCLSQTPISFFKDGKFEEKQVNVKIKPLNWEQNPLHLISHHLVQEAHNLRQLACLHRSDVSFLLGLGEEPVQHHLTTGHERLGNLLMLAQERNTYCMMHTVTAEDPHSSKNSRIVMGNNDEHKSSSIDDLLQLYSRPFYKGPESQNNVNLTLRRMSPESLTEHCHFTTSDFWVLTFVFRPTRNILFVYIADRRDVLHQEVCLDDKEYEFSIQCWQWQQCRHNLLKVREMHKPSGLTPQAQVLSLLVGAAEESAAKQFIEMMFTSSASETDFGAYKDRPLLTEVTAKDNGNKELAHHHKDITKRGELPFMEQSTSGAIPIKPPDRFFKSVILLKNGDFQRIGGQVYMPTASEIATLKTAPQLGQFKRKAEFFASMTEDMVEKKLEDIFPYLKNRRFSFAAAVKLDKETSRFECHRSPRSWNGKTIRRKIKGSSALYILEDEAPSSGAKLNSTKILQDDNDAMTCIATDVSQISLLDDSPLRIEGGQQVTLGDEYVAVQSNIHEDQGQMSDSSEESSSSTDNGTTSGIGSEFSEDLKDLSLAGYLKENVHFEVSVNPTESPLLKTLIMNLASNSEKQAGAVKVKRAQDDFSKTVILLKKNDCQRRNGEVYLPNTIEMANIKKKSTGQYKTKVQFSKQMSEEMVRQKLQETFTTFNLNGTIFCAAVSQDSITFRFHGDRRIWDGKTIKQIIKGNSVLYIVMDDDQSSNSGTELTSSNNPQGDDNAMSCIATNVNEMSLLDDSQMEIDYDEQVTPGDQNVTVESGNNNIYMYQDQRQMSDNSEESSSSADNTTSSGIGGEFSEEELSTLIWRLPDQFEVSIDPKESPLEGGAFCQFIFKPKLYPEVTSGRATFEDLGTFQLERLSDGSLLGKIPASREPGLVTVILESQHGIRLGQTCIKYNGMEEVLKKKVFSPDHKRTFEKLMDMYCGLGESSEETQNPVKTSLDGVHREWNETCEIERKNLLKGFAEPDQLLSLLVYTAAKVGAQQFIEIIFNTSSGRVVFDVYKERSPLPEVVARDHGNEETARYLEGITKRFSAETRTGQECPKTIDWSELVKAAEAAQKRLNPASEEENYPIKTNVSSETGYLEDVDTSSSDTSSKKDPASKEKNYPIETNVPKETGYLGDVDTSSSGSTEKHSSDSDDSTTTTPTKEVKDICPSLGSEEEIKQVMDSNLLNISGISDLTEAEMQQERNDLEDLKVKTRKAISNVSVTVNSHRAAADYLDDVWRKCSKARCAGNTGGVTGGLLTIAGGFAMLASAGAAMPLLLAGLGFGVAGAGANVVASIGEAVINSSEIKKAERDLHVTLDSIKEVQATVKKWLVEKDKTKLLYICHVAEQTLKVSDPAVIDILIKEVLPSLESKVKSALTSAALWATAKTVTGAAIATGAQAAGGVLQALAQAGVRGVAGKLVVGAGAACLLWDAKNLQYSIQEIAENKGSDAARCLRQKAVELENAIPFSSNNP